MVEVAPSILVIVLEFLTDYSPLGHISLRERPW